jgi:predicted Zn-dependent protease
LNLPVIAGITIGLVTLKTTSNVVGPWFVVLAMLGAASCSNGGDSQVRAPQAEDGEAIAFAAIRTSAAAAPASPLLDLLANTANEHLQRLQSDAVDEAAYFIAYDVVDVKTLVISARGGAILGHDLDHERFADVDVRVGSRTLDNSHIGTGGSGDAGIGSSTQVALDDDALSIEQALWLTTYAKYREAKDAIELLRDEERTRVVEANKEHPDFSEEGPVTYYRAPIVVDFAALSRQWSEKVRAVSGALAAIDPRTEAQSQLSAELRHRHFVNTEGSRVQDAQLLLRLSLEVSIQADDGMVLSRTKIFDAVDPGEMPDDAQLKSAVDELASQVMALRKAPLAEPYIGPAILEGMAAGVFFHEIFGHRLEAQRQKKDDEGQTFADMLRKPILPTFLDVTDDPTLSRLNGISLNGAYAIDDEAVVARPVELVRRGVLQTFLLGRSPVLPFLHSNGHGRRQIGYPLAARQGNLIINSRRTLDAQHLRKTLIEEIKRQKKPYGLRFAEINGGYTTTERTGPQAFKVEPTMVFRVYADGRPDELVRGADLVGTPLTAFSTILATGDQLEIFNGYCFAESGWVPVSAVAPSLLLRQIEVERAQHERERPPLLTPPTGAALRAKKGANVQ